VCPQCGFPLRPGAPSGFGGGPARAAQSGSRMVFWILGIAGAGLLVVVALGVMAAIAIPRFSKAVRDARVSNRQAELMLRDAWTREQAYLAANGVYAATLEDLRGVGWEDPPDSAGFDLSVMTWGPGNLCIEAMSRTGAGRVLSIQDDGRGEPVGCSMGSTATDAAEEARIVLQQGWQLLTAYRREHGTLPRDLTGITPRIERQGALASFRLGYTRGVNASSACRCARAAWRARSAA
jgi:Tfp pilus assembly protein PilE